MKNFNYLFLVCAFSFHFLPLFAQLIPGAVDSKVLFGKKKNGYAVKSYELKTVVLSGGLSQQTTYYIIQVGNFDDKGLLQGEGMEYYGTHFPKSTNNGEPYTLGNALAIPNILELYKGSFINGIKEGKGIAESYERYQVVERYEGEFRNSLPNGKGKYARFGTLYNQTKFITESYYGYFRNGFFHGPGQLHTYDGSSSKKRLSVKFGFFAFGKNVGIYYSHYIAKEGSVPVYFGIGSGNAKTKEEPLIKVPFDEFKSYFDSLTMDNLKQTIEVGHKNKDGLLQGFGYRINNSGEFQFGYFDNGKLNTYGAQFRNLETFKDMKRSDELELVELKEGRWSEGKIYSGEQKRYGNKQQNGSSFPSEDIISSLAGDKLFLKLETYNGSFDENELFSGKGSYYTYDGGEVYKGTVYSYEGSFKEGKFNGLGKYTVDETAKKTTTDALYENGEQKEVFSSTSKLYFSSITENTIVEINGLPGLVEKNEAFKKTTYDGRVLTEKDKWVIRTDINSSAFFEPCNACNGNGQTWGTCTHTETYTSGYNTHREMITMGSNTYIETTYTPKYKTSITTYNCPKRCEVCKGISKHPRTTQQLKAAFGSK